MDETTYSLTELADTADVSTRTVRYYISEGLLPPPEGAGHASRYTVAHLVRLREIAALKAQYLPLREIRNRLVDLPPALDEERSPRSSARDYLRTLRRSPAPQGQPHEEDGGVAYAMPPPMMSPPEEVDELAPPDVLAMDRSPPETVWRRIPIGPAAELVITDDLYRRRRDKVDWLVRWARKVIDG